MSNIMDVNFNGTTAEMLKIISDYDEVSGFKGAYNCLLYTSPSPLD